MQNSGNSTGTPDVQNVTLTSWSPPTSTVYRAELVQALSPHGLAHHVKQDTPTKTLDALRRKLPWFLDTHMKKAGTGRKRGEEHSIVTSKPTSLNKSGSNPELGALSARLTTGGGTVGDYARVSSPVGELIIHKDSTISPRGPQWFFDAVYECQRSVSGVVTNTELLKIWRSILSGVGAWNWTKLAWFIPPTHLDVFRNAHTVFTQLGAYVPSLDVTLGLGGSNEAEVLESMLKHAFGTMQGFAERLIQARDDQQDFFDASSERKQGIRLGQLEDNKQSLEGLCKTLDSLLTVVDDGAMYMGVGAGDIREAAHELFQSYEATCGIDRKHELVPTHAGTIAEKVYDLTKTELDDLFTETTTPETPEPETPDPVIFDDDEPAAPKQAAEPETTPEEVADFDALFD